MLDANEPSFSKTVVRAEVSPFAEITEENVRAALDALLYSSGTRPVSSLQRLLLVDQVLDDLDLPCSPSIREFALNLALTSIIQSELADHRGVFGRTPLEQEYSLEAIHEAIVMDFRTANPELMSWSWLYYRYVRVDLNLSPMRFSSIAHVDERTLRRYQQHGIRRLTQRLIEQECLGRRRKEYSTGKPAALSIIRSTWAPFRSAQFDRSPFG